MFVQTPERAIMKYNQQMMVILIQFILIIMTIDCLTQGLEIGQNS